MCSAEAPDRIDEMRVRSYRLIVLGEREIDREQSLKPPMAVGGFLAFWPQEQRLLYMREHARSIAQLRVTCQLAGGELKLRGAANNSIIAMVYEPFNGV